MDAAAPRLDPALPEPPLALAEPGARTGVLFLSGGLILLLGTVALGLAGFAADQFARAAWLGWTTLAVAGTGLGLVGAGVWRELRAMWRMRTVDELRAGLSSGDPARVMAAARAWAMLTAEGAAVLPALREVNDPDAAVALLRAGPGAALRMRTDALGRVAAVQAVAAVAAVPSPALDALLIGWRGVRLVRQVAGLYGVRPGLVGTMSLLRRTALSASLVGGAEMGVNLAAQAILGSPLLAHLAGDAAGAGIAARRMMLLARAASAACDPVTPS